MPEGPGKLSPLAARLQRALGRGALVPPGSRCLVALSGGSDSMALLHLLLELAPARGLGVEAAHLDHALREGSAADRARVEAWCHELGVPCHADRVDVQAHRDRLGLSREMAARQVRYRFLFSTAREREATCVATAHTADDQAETVLLRLVSGTGLRGLAAVRPRHGRLLVRPLLGFTRSELQGYLEERGLPWLEDPTNRDPDQPRAWVRHRVLPLLRERNPSIVRALARLARAALQQEELMAGLSAAVRAREEPGSLSVDRLRALPAALRRRVLADLAGPEARPLGASHLDALEALLEGGSGGSTHLPGGRVARREGRRLHLDVAPPGGLPSEPEKAPP